MSFRHAHFLVNVWLPIDLDGEVPSGAGESSGYCGAMYREPRRHLYSSYCHRIQLL